MKMGRAVYLAVAVFTLTVQVAAAAQKAIRAITPDQPISDVKTMRDVVSGNVSQPRFYTLLLGIYAAIALLLAATGLYGVLSYAVSQRLREIGIRLALGARPAQIRVLVLSHGMHLLLIGSAIGLFSAFVLSRALQSVLFEVSGVDPKIYLGVGLLLFGATLFASWIPAHRASRVDPSEALRIE
jgi:ABC-type antimicrobial peptide transport system permease subunit